VRRPPTQESLTRAVPQRERDTMGRIPVNSCCGDEQAYKETVLVFDETAEKVVWLIEPETSEPF
jgi:hypothetical protein